MQESIYLYKPGEFKHFIQNIDDKSITVTEVIGDWREFKNLTVGLKRMTIQQLTDNPILIEELAKALLTGMKAEFKFQLPYNKEERKKELIENISERINITKHEAESKIVIGHYKDPKTWQEFNYCLEVVIAPLNDEDAEDAGFVKIIGNINSSTHIDGGAKYFDGSYFWIDRKGRSMNASNLRGILHECGFNTSASMSKRRVPCVVYLNLETPCPEWLGGAGKTHINTRPYADNIAKTVSSLAYKMPSYHGQGYGTRTYDYGTKAKSAISYLDDFLRDRFDKIKANPSLRKEDRITQSGGWYRMRPIMIRDGFKPKTDWGTTRVYLRNKIDERCKTLSEAGAFGKGVVIEREDLGIVAKARGMMLYDGHVYPIDIDSLEELGKKGVFILVIEKEIAYIFKDVARDSGVVLVHTGGKFTKYVKDFIERARVPIATLTDYDVDGKKIAAETWSVVARIGIDMDIIQWLQQNGHADLRLEDVEEEYTPRTEPDNEYLKHHRIELDSIAERVGPESFWKYIRYKIEKQQEEDGFDYNNVIDEPETETLYPTAMKELISKFDLYLGKITRGESEEIYKEQESVKQLNSIDDKKLDNSLRLEKIVAEDEVMQNQIIPIIEKLSKELSDLLE